MTLINQKQRLREVTQQLPAKIKLAYQGQKAQRFHYFHFLHLQGMRVKYKSSNRRYSIKKTVLKNFAIFTGRHLCWSLFLIKLMDFRHRCFPVNIAKFLRTPILKNICEWLLLRSEVIHIFSNSTLIW